MSDLKQRRLDLGVTQSAVAQIAGLKYPAEVGLAERGQATARVTNMVADALHILKRRKAEEAAIAVASERLEAIIASMPPSQEWSAFQKALQDRAIRYLDDVKAECCDALLEFVPKAEAAQILDDYFDPPEADTSPTPQGQGEPETPHPPARGREAP